MIGRFGIEVNISQSLFRTSMLDGGMIVHFGLGRLFAEIAACVVRVFVRCLSCFNDGGHCHGHITHVIGGKCYAAFFVSTGRAELAGCVRPRTAWGGKPWMFG